jgi:SAM-dependent methyltransferase
MLRASLERLRDRSFTLLTLNYAVGELRYRLGLREHLSGATHARHTVDAGADYVAAVFRDYLAVGGLEPTDLPGRAVLEVGPGDNVGVALQFAAAGAREVVCLDRFSSLRDEAKNREVYRALRTRYAQSGLDFSRVLTPDGAIREGIVDLRVDVPIERAAEHFPREHFDLIISRAVLEHVYDVDAAWASMDALLTPGGKLLHKIDFRNHGFYASLHPLRFLTVPERLWKLISAPDPTLNRRRVSTYERLAREGGYALTVGVTHLASRDEEFVPPRYSWKHGIEYADEDLVFVRRIRPRLVAPFRAMDDRELLISGVFLCAEKARR